MWALNISFIQAKLPPFPARSFARANTAVLDLGPVSFRCRRIDCSTGKPVLEPCIPPSSVLPNAQTQSPNPSGVWGGSVGSYVFPFPSCSHMGVAREDTSGVQASLLVVPLLLLHSPLPPELGRWHPAPWRVLRVRHCAARGSAAQPSPSCRLPLAWSGAL